MRVPEIPGIPEIPECVEESVWIRSDHLRLEGILSYPAEATATVPAALLCPPHPFLGGDMNGNVMKALRTELTSRGIMTLSFNYRGIGSSQTDSPLESYQREFWNSSTCPEYEKKIFVDSASAFKYLKSIAGDRPLHMAGYSFGCLPALELATVENQNISTISIISPPLKQWKLKSHYCDISIPKIVCYSPGDFACPRDLLEATYAVLSSPKQLTVFEECDHFYIGKEKEVARTVAEFVRDQVGKI